jgi:hypothetical protein
MKRRVMFQVAHHLIAHPLVGLSLGRLWAWRLHDWTAAHAWPKEPSISQRRRWAGLE